MRVAALDLGSNTFLLLIADVEDSKIQKIFLDETRVTRLGQGVHSQRVFHEEALARAELCLAEFSALIKKFNCEKVVAVATSAARDVSNGHLLIEMGAKYSIPISIVDGATEAKITFSGALDATMDSENALVIDVGGGSTEIIGADSGRNVKGYSLNVGSVRLNEMFLKSHPCSKEDLSQLDAYVREQLRIHQESLPKAKGEVVAVAGTPTTLATLQLKKDFDEKLVHGFELSLEEIWSWRQRLAELSVVERQALPGMQINRADVLVAGASILALACEAVEANRVTVSTKGVRYGVAKEWQKILELKK